MITGILQNILTLVQVNYAQKLFKALPFPVDKTIKPNQSSTNNVEPSMDPFIELFSLNKIKDLQNSHKNAPRYNNAYQKALTKFSKEDQQDPQHASSLPIDFDRRGGEDRRLDKKSQQARFDLRNKNDRRKSTAFSIKI